MPLPSREFYFGDAREITESLYWIDPEHPDWVKPEICERSWFKSLGKYESQILQIATNSDLRKDSLQVNFV